MCMTCMQQMQFLILSQRMAQLTTEDSKKPKLGHLKDDKRAEAFLEVAR